MGPGGGPAGQRRPRARGPPAPGPSRPAEAVATLRRAPPLSLGRRRAPRPLRTSGGCRRPFPRVPGRAQPRGAGRDARAGPRPSKEEPGCPGWDLERGPSWPRGSGRLSSPVPPPPSAPGRRAALVGLRFMTSLRHGRGAGPDLTQPSRGGSGRGGRAPRGARGPRPAAPPSRSPRACGAGAGRAVQPAASSVSPARRRPPSLRAGPRLHVRVFTHVTPAPPTCPGHAPPPRAPRGKGGVWKWAGPFLRTRRGGRPGGVAGVIPPAGPACGGAAGAR